MKAHTIRVLNLYSGLGGNRKLWPKNCQVTAVELNPDLVSFYKDHFPGDVIFKECAHQFLLDHYKEFDFIWSSPPCQSHSQMRHNLAVRFRGTKPCYPDFKLYEEIVFLKTYAKCKWVVENVRPYYQPLFSPQTIQRHLFWTNFEIQDRKFKTDILRSAQIPDLQKHHGFDLTDYKIKNKRQVLRNCIQPELGLHVLTAFTKIPRNS